MPKILRARPPHDDGEERKIRKLAGARHAPADWSERARIITPSWDGLGEHACPEGTIYVVTGNLSSHDSKSTRAWLEDHPRIRHAFIPKGAC